MIDRSMEAADDYRSIYTPNQMCTWLTNRLVDGLFETDLRDAWGDIQVYNRVAVRASPHPRLILLAASSPHPHSLAPLPVSTVAVRA